MKTLAHQLEPAGCSKTFTFDSFNQLDDSDLEGLIAEEKFDGRRYLFQVRPNKAKHNFLTSRRVGKNSGLMVEKQDSLPYLRDCAFGPRDTVYDSELMHPDGGTSHEAATAIAQGTAVCRVFDVLRFAGEDVRHLPLFERWKLLDKVKGALPDHVEMVPRSRNPRKLLAAVRAIDGEGIILKMPSAVYGEGWFKVVSVEYADAVVVGFEMSKSDKYGPKKWIKGMQIGQWAEMTLDEAIKTGHRVVETKGVKGRSWVLLQLGQISGFTENERARISANMEKTYGRVVIIKFKGRELSGAFRHPRFHSWHPDKNNHECRFGIK